MLKRAYLSIIILCLMCMSLAGCSRKPVNTATTTEAPSMGESTTEETVTTEPYETEEPTTVESSTAEPTTEATSTEATSTEEPSTEEPSTEEPTTEIPSTEAPSTETPLRISDVAFVGDSRTLTMATGGRLEFALIPDSSIFATWGGELHQDSAKNNALNAAAANRKLAVFWYGINDVQSDPGQTLADQFLANYKAIIDLYQNGNPDSDIVILSILSTSVHEKDYYDGQEENIRRYNAKLADLCAERGYTYLDISALFTGDDCLAPGDNIHFSKEWYLTRFLPTVLPQIGIRSYSSIIR